MAHEQQGVSKSWIENHFRCASRIATAIEQFAKRQRMEVADVLEAADSRNWQMFATLAGCRPEYQPSEETRAFVAEIVRDHQQAVCVECGLRQGELQAAAERKVGTEVCPSCWPKKYGAHAQAEA